MIVLVSRICRRVVGVALMLVDGANAFAGELEEWRYLAPARINWRSYGDATLADTPDQLLVMWRRSEWPEPDLGDI